MHRFRVQAFGLTLVFITELVESVFEHPVREGCIHEYPSGWSRTSVAQEMRCQGRNFSFRSRQVGFVSGLGLSLHKV